MAITKEMLLNELSVLQTQLLRNKDVAAQAQAATDQVSGAIQLANHLLVMLRQEEETITQSELEEMTGGKVVGIKKLEEEKTEQ